MKPEPFPKRRENQTQLQHARDCTYLSLGYSSAPSMIDTPSLRFFVGKRSTEAPSLQPAVVWHAHPPDDHHRSGFNHPDTRISYTLLPSSFAY